MSDRDERAAAYFDDSSNLEVGGRQFQRRTGRGPLNEHVPIRFDTSSIERVKEFADQDGVTVSTWIRRVVEREVEKRLMFSVHSETSQSFVAFFQHVKSALETTTEQETTTESGSASFRILSR